MRVPKTKTKDFILNLNVYRNTHYQTLNKVKINYKEAVKPQIAKLPKYGKIALVFTLYPKTRLLTDISNVCSIHDKFFCDALVEFGKIEDDNYKFVPEITYRIGHVDKENPRVEIEIKEIL